MKMAPAAAAVPAALGSAMLTRYVQMTTPGIRKKRTREITEAIALIRCLSHSVKRTASAKPMTEHTACIRPLFVMLFAKASRAAIGTPPMAAMRMPDPISVMRASAPLTSA